EAGYSTRMIADDLGLSLGTAGHRVEQLLHALVAINRTHAVALGWQYGILGRSRTGAPAASPSAAPGHPEHGRRPPGLSPAPRTASPAPVNPAASGRIGRRPTDPDEGHQPVTSQTTDPVTDRARVIIEHLAKGDRREEIAHVLRLSRASVQREITKACSGLKVPNRCTALVDSAISRGIITLPPCDPVDLSTAQVAELRLIAAGQNNPEIAAARGIPANTVSGRVGQIMKLLGAKNRVHAVALGWQRGILGPPGQPPSSSTPAAPHTAPGTPAHRPEHTNGDRRL
ncbi:LuxR C-terminal-related transcriptional regulator, partial [Streptomyces sp. NPDC017405]|uniref:LuxR C-terminal-related transcriptional regulator n=1 Tax=unclassified Streptomyces TaxID=2593676 RepID=UPI0037B8DA5E